MSHPHDYIVWIGNDAETCDAGSSARLDGANVHVLMYHEILGSGSALDRTDPYAVSSEEFAVHLSTIASRVDAPPVRYSITASGETIEAGMGGGAWAITFDDGRAGSMLAADLLEARGWRGHIFVIADRIGTPGYLDQEQVLELHRRGHVIGSHSTTHPAAMASLPMEDLLAEWQGSASMLSYLLGVPVEVAAVPGGSYSRPVAAAAARAGIKILFTSEPTTRTQQVDGCLVVGRYLIRRGTSADAAAGLATGQLRPRASQAARWKARTVAAAVLGRHYFTVRSMVLHSRRPG